MKSLIRGGSYLNSSSPYIASEADQSPDDYETFITQMFTELEGTRTQKRREALSLPRYATVTTES